VHCHLAYVVLRWYLVYAYSPCKIGVTPSAQERCNVSTVSSCLCLAALYLPARTHQHEPTHSKLHKLVSRPASLGAYTHALSSSGEHVAVKAGAPVMLHRAEMVPFTPPSLFTWQVPPALAVMQHDHQPSMGMQLMCSQKEQLRKVSRRSEEVTTAQVNPTIPNTTTTAINTIQSW